MMKRLISLVLRLAVVVFAVLGVYLQLTWPGHFYATPFLFFTIQSNIWIAVVCAVGVVGRIFDLKPGRVLSVLKMSFTVAITLTGVVYAGLLAPFIPEGAYAFPSLCVHAIVPVAAVLDYLVSSKDYQMRGVDAWWGLVPPLYYFCFASLGYILKWDFGGGQRFPYFFLNWGGPAGAFGFDYPEIGVVWYVIFLMIVLYAVSRLFVGLTGQKTR